MRNALALGAFTTFAIACGTDSVPSTFQADPPSVYVAKVKNILVGLAPTDAEVQAVVKDPTALGGLVDGWMATPEYQQKMMVFFELAFQQTQINQTSFVDLLPPQGFLFGRGLVPLVQNIRESFARTALELAAEGHPLTDGFTTHTLMMTPALMELYALLDARRVDDAGKVTDSFAKANPTLKITMETSAGPIAITDSLNPTSANYMHFYTPDLPAQTYPDPTCNAMDPITFPASAQALHDVLFGAIPIHQSATGGNCQEHTGSAMSVQFAPTDFTTWKMVTIRKPGANEATTNFYDLPTLRSATQLVLGTPHVGFFSTPAFWANWPTNMSNQMRVTLNQALIIATGSAIDGTDPTTPATTPGLDGAHSQPGSACLGCHQQLDPTRSILSSTYSWFYYAQSDAMLMAQPGLFVYRGVIAPMKTIDDFASLLASHPLVPQAWAQKLCYYVNSAPCDVGDPEFQRIVNDFKGNNLAWNGLVKAIVTSPITTNAAETATVVTNGETIAVSRRDHLCAALNNRLGFVDICQLDVSLANRTPTVISQIVSGMPSDGYGRGGVIPVLPNQPNLFYRAGLENVCEGVAQMVIDAKPNPQQPGAKKWSSAQPDAAIADFVGIVMALTPSDVRTAQATAILTDHFTQATQTGATASDALKSTFVAACLSPSFIGIGM